MRHTMLQYCCRPIQYNHCSGLAARQANLGESIFFHSDCSCSYSVVAVVLYNQDTNIILIELYNQTMCVIVMVTTLSCLCSIEVQTGTTHGGKNQNERKCKRDYVEQLIDQYLKQQKACNSSDLTYLMLCFRCDSTTPLAYF